jgi:hypothetical protein
LRALAWDLVLRTTPIHITAGPAIGVGPFSTQNHVLALEISHRRLEALGEPRTHHVYSPQLAIEKTSPANIGGKPISNDALNEQRGADFENKFVG